MEARKGYGFTRACVSAFCAIALVGCGHDGPLIATQSETDIAISQIKDEWLTKCAGLGPEKDNNIGNLLQEYGELAALLAVCMKRHNDFVDYLAPVVAKQKQK